MSVNMNNMERSENIGTVLQKIAIVSTQMDTLVKSADNPFFKSKYVPLEKVQEALAPHLAETGLGISQPLYGKGIATIVTDIETGNWVLFPAEINTDHVKPQDQMSGVTYMKRYALIGLFNLIVDKDDDGNKASATPIAKKISVPLEHTDEEDLEF